MGRRFPEYIRGSQRGVRRQIDLAGGRVYREMLMGVWWVATVDMEGSHTVGGTSGRSTDRDARGERRASGWHERIKEAEECGAQAAMVGIKIIGSTGFG